MSLFKTLLRAVQSWSRRRSGGPKASRRAGVSMERLDHRQMLSVTFTGNPTTDIPNSGAAGTVILSDPGPGAQYPVIHPAIPNYLKPLIPVSGFDINGIRLQYDAQLDTLDVAIDQPDSQLGNGKPVIAGDADDNGNGGTVNPDVLAVQPQFKDFANLGGSEYMAVFLDLNNDGTPDVVAGVSNDPTVGKQYQVAQAIVNSGSTDHVANVIPPVSFGQTLANNTGFAFLNDSNPDTPGFEFQITNFSKLYQEETGNPLTTTSTIQVGGTAGSGDDFIGEAFFPGQSVTLGVVPPAAPVTPPSPACPPAAPPEPPAPVPVTPPPPVIPPLEPPIVINPHLHRHVNTAHPTDVRVTVLGSERFNVDDIIQTSVRLGGAAPIYSFDLQATNQPFADRTFVFRGSDINLPRGITLAEVTGTLTTGQTFDSYYQIFNRNDSYYSPAQIAEQKARQAAKGFSADQSAADPHAGEDPGQGARPGAGHRGQSPRRDLHDDQCPHREDRHAKERDAQDPDRPQRLRDAGCKRSRRFESPVRTGRPRHREHPPAEREADGRLGRE